MKCGGVQCGKRSHPIKQLLYSGIKWAVRGRGGKIKRGAAILWPYLLELKNKTIALLPTPSLLRAK